MNSGASYIEHLAQLAAKRAPFVAVTLIEATGSVPQDTGTKMLVNAMGLVYGTVGGGKVEHKAIQRAQEMLDDESSANHQLENWNLQNDVGMTCGGAVKLYFEIYNRDNWRIIVFGAGHVAQATIECLHRLDCQIVCVDHREEWLSKLPSSKRIVKRLCQQPIDFLPELRDDDFVVCMTMGHSTDLPILAEIFRSGVQPGYLGVIGSRAKRKVLLRELAEQGISQEAIREFHCPIGLPLGSNQPAEIAISIVAQMLQHRDALKDGG